MKKRNTKKRNTKKRNTKKRNTKIPTPSLKELGLAHRETVYEVRDEETKCDRKATEILRNNPRAVVLLLDKRGSFLAAHSYPDKRATELHRAVYYDKLLDLWGVTSDPKKKKRIESKLDKMDRQDARNAAARPKRNRRR